MTTPVTIIAGVVIGAVGLIFAAFMAISSSNSHEYSYEAERRRRTRLEIRSRAPTPREPNYLRRQREINERRAAVNEINDFIGANPVNEIQREEQPEIGVNEPRAPVNERDVLLGADPMNEIQREEQPEIDVNVARAPVNEWNVLLEAEPMNEIQREEHDEINNISEAHNITQETNEDENPNPSTSSTVSINSLNSFDNLANDFNDSETGNNEDHIQNSTITQEETDVISPPHSMNSFELIEGVVTGDNELTNNDNNHIQTISRISQEEVESDTDNLEITDSDSVLNTSQEIITDSINRNEDLQTAGPSNSTIYDQIDNIETLTSTISSARINDTNSYESNSEFSDSIVIVEVCSICRDIMNEPGTRVILECDHEFHMQCLLDATMHGIMKCPNCQMALNVRISR